ncbi:MAG: Glutamine amidotransferase, class I, partial [uncultured Microvirga sp.]
EPAGHRGHHLAAGGVAQLSSAPPRAVPGRRAGDQAGRRGGDARAPRRPRRRRRRRHRRRTLRRAGAARRAHRSRARQARTAAPRDGAARRPAHPWHLSRLADDQHRAWRVAAHRHLRGLCAGAADAHRPAAQDRDDRRRQPSRPDPALQPLSGERPAPPVGRPAGPGPSRRGPGRGRHRAGHGGHRRAVSARCAVASRTAALPGIAATDFWRACGGCAGTPVGRTRGSARRGLGRRL